jgi:spore germination protein GerM
MALADRIIARRSVAMPGWTVAVAAAALVIVVGGSSIMLFRGDDGPTGVAAADTTEATSVAATSPSTDPAPSEVAPTTTTTVVAAATAESPVPGVVAYLLMEDPNATGPSPSLMPIVRSAAPLEPLELDSPEAAVEALLMGPTPEEQSMVPAVSTAIPDDTRLLGPIEVVGGVATVDLSAEFATGSGTFSEIARLEQVVYTLTRFPDIDAVRFEIEGEAVEVFGGHGIVFDGPMARSDFDTALPSILIESPVYGAAAGYPLVARGTANVFEASVSIALTDAEGLILWEGATTATCGTGCRGTWEITIPYEVAEPQWGALIVWEESARDGSQLNVREHRVWLIPRNDATADTGDITPRGDCSAALVTEPPSGQPDLPVPVAETRAAILNAATLCDWDLLRSVMTEPFSFSFGPPGDAIEWWQSLEADGYEPMRFLVELLDRPYAVQDLGEVVYYWWPSAFPVPWDEVPAADRDALRPLFDDDDFAGFEAFGGYFGYRVGITDAGEWVVFVEGD